MTVLRKTIVSFEIPQEARSGRTTEPIKINAFRLLINLASKLPVPVFMNLASKLYLLQWNNSSSYQSQAIKNKNEISQTAMYNWDTCNLNLQRIELGSSITEKIDISYKQRKNFEICLFLKVTSTAKVVTLKNNKITKYFRLCWHERHKKQNNTHNGKQWQSQNKQ